MSFDILAAVAYSDEWAKARRGRITSSKINAALAKGGTIARKAYRDTLVLDLLGIQDHEDEYPAHWLLTAREQKAAAAAWYISPAGGCGELLPATPGFIARSDCPWLGCSPHGFTPDNGIVHLKTRHSVRRLAENPDEKTLTRIRYELLVSGSAFCDFVQFCPHANRGTVTKIYPEPIAENYIEFAANLFWLEVLNEYKQRTNDTYAGENSNVDEK
jgi:hypothetical protein